MNAREESSTRILQQKEEERKKNVQGQMQAMVEKDNQRSAVNKSVRLK